MGHRVGARFVSPRLISTTQAREYLGGRHPSELGVKPIGNGRGQVWDVRAIDRALDGIAGLLPAPQPEAQADEHQTLRQRIAAHASRRA
jgi:hypothetical protein